MRKVIINGILILRLITVFITLKLKSGKTSKHLYTTDGSPEEKDYVIRFVMLLPRKYL